MRNKVVIVDESGLRVEDAPEVIDLKYIYSICCKDTPSNKIVQAVYRRFADEDIIIWCHEEGRLIPLHSYCVVPSGEDFAGPILVCASGQDEDGATEIPLTDHQVDIVRNSIHVLKVPVLRELF
jgi:hypothetical protein